MQFRLAISHSKLIQRTFVLGCALAFAGASQAREPWQIQHPEGAPPTGPIGKGWTPPPSGSTPGLVNSGSNNANSNSSAMAPGLMASPNSGPMPAGNGIHGRQAVTNEMIQQILSSRVGAGSVLTGVLGDDISSKKSFPGDLFSVVLVDGYSQNGNQLIPRGSRIIGKVVQVASAAIQRPGAPGNVEVGLTTLVFPDGRSTPFTGFIDRNPAHDMKKPPVVRGPGMSMSDYKGAVGSMLGSFTSGIGAVRRRTNRGKDLLLQEGDVVPVRVTRSVDLTKMSPPTAPPAQPLANPYDPAINTSVNSGTMGGAPVAPAMTGANPGVPVAGQSPLSGDSPLLPKELPDPF